MQALSTEPTDSELAVLLDPEGRSPSVRVTDTPGQLVAKPRGFPLWFVTFCGVSVLICHTLLDPQEVLGLVIGVPATVTLIGFFWWKNRQIVSKGTFFVLDKDHRILTLPRLGLEVQASEVLGFVEVHAWHTVWDKEGPACDWLAELSVLVSIAPGEVARYPAITCMRTGKIGRLAAVLADFFGVDRRVLKLNWQARRRLRAEGRAEA
jgi:hypothetical protein